MTTNKTQIRGNCQCCGRDQAVVQGHMSKHGYTVEDGWFNGVCSGDGYQPLQVSRERTDAICVSVLADVAKLQLDLIEVQEGRKFPKFAKDGLHHRAKEIPFAEAPDHLKQRAVKGLLYSIEGRIRAGQHFAADMTKLADKIHGTALTTVVLEAAPVIEVGSKVKFSGKEVIVTKIAFATARGIGPGINGQNVEHVYWTTESGQTFGYPKRYVRLVK